MIKYCKTGLLLFFFFNNNNFEKPINLASQPFMLVNLVQVF